MKILPKLLLLSLGTLLLAGCSAEATDANRGLFSTFALDWQIVMAATAQWSQGGNPYGVLSPEFGLPTSPDFGFNLPGAFAYPPTALTWFRLFLPFGAFSYYLWTALEIGGWWLLIRRHYRAQLFLLGWAPLIVHFFLGQNTLAVVLVLWAATRAKQRGLGWGLALAWTLTKPQVALLPILWLLWQDRVALKRYQLWLGILLGSLALALPPTLINPGIWLDWLQGLADYRSRLGHFAPWQGFGAPILLLATWLWFRRYRGRQAEAGWQWWFSVATFPQTGIYAVVSLLPLNLPALSYWAIGGFALAGLLIGPATPASLPILLSGQMLAVWLITKEKKVL
jgi:hypothetical protein